MTQLNHLMTAMGATAFVLTFAFSPSGFSQQPGGMSPMDIQNMMAQCAQAREQIQQQMQQYPGMPLTGEMQQMIAQCDQIDLMHGQSGGDPGQQVPLQPR